MKHLFIISALILALVWPGPAMAQDLESDGICYHIDGDHAIVTNSSYPYSGDVVIPASISHNGVQYPVTAINGAAFWECSSLTSVTIPASVTTIGDQAFAGCTALDSVDINNLKAWCNIEFYTPSANPCSYAHRLFLNGAEITDLVIPDSVQSISSFAFWGCSSINRVSIADSVTSIGWGAFNNCPSLTAINVAAGNPHYDSRDSCNAIIYTASGTLLAGCRNTVIPRGVTAIGNWAFYGCTGLSGLFLPNTVAEIGYESFYGCSSLVDVNIPNSVRTIGCQAFYGCSSLKSIHIPGSVRGIASSVFEYCPSLLTMSVAHDNPNFDSRDECNAIIVTDENTLIAGCRNTVIPSTVTAIGNDAFDGCLFLEAVTIPQSVTTIGRKAFHNCPALMEVVCRIANPALAVTALDAFKLPSADYTGRVLHVPTGSAAAFQASDAWQPYFPTITDQK